MPATEPVPAIHVGLVSPPSLLREGLIAVLGRDPDLTLHVSDDPHAPADELRDADALVVDGNERAWSTAVEAAERGGVPPQKVLILCKVGSAHEVAELLALNVAGCLLPNERPEAVVEKVRAVACGDWRASRRDLFRLMEEKQRGQPNPPPSAAGNARRSTSSQQASATRGLRRSCS